jgi:hypothetical protein
VATYLVKLACELPDQVGRSLSTWTCAELARTLERDGIVSTISEQSIQRILESHRLKPWRIHHWLSAKVPRDAHFHALVLTLCDLYTRPIVRTERIISLDEMTSIQPRTRSHSTKPAQENNKPVLVEHEYERKGALNLLAGFDIQTGQVIGLARRRKRQDEFIELLEEIEHDTSPDVQIIYLICDNLKMHSGKKVQAWFVHHPRFKMHFTPIHCSWMNQVEQWFSIIKRKRLVAPNFENLEHLAERISAFIFEWNQIAHPFAWTKKSFEKVLNKVDRSLEKAA